MGSSYREGNFGGNQLLDGSISLSPLYPSQTNDLHVSIAAGLHHSFFWLRLAQASFTIFPCPTGMLSLEPFTSDRGRSAVQPTRGSHQSASLRLTGLLARCLAHMSDSLVRVSGRAEWGAHRPPPGARECRSTPRRRVLPSTITVMTSPQAYQQPGLWPPP